MLKVLNCVLQVEYRTLLVRINTARNVSVFRFLSAIKKSVFNITTYNSLPSAAFNGVSGRVERKSLRVAHCTPQKYRGGSVI
jgi:hypothetical protein